MTGTRSFTPLVDARLAGEPQFRDVPLRESVDTMLSGDTETGKATLRRSIEGTIGFAAPGDGMRVPPHAVEHMFEPNADRNAGSLFEVLHHLQKRAGLRLHVTR